jgi:large subunit ribosomal protein L23
MGLFSSKKNTEEKKDDTKAVVKKAPAKKVVKKVVAKKVAKKSSKPVRVPSNKDRSYVLRKVRITEKAAHSYENKVYTFDIDPRATKLDVKIAIQEKYDVTPAKVRVLAIPSKRIVVRGKRGVKSGGKKAYVFLHKDDVIEFV